MCGILAVLDRRGGLPSPAFEAALETLAHRGPDGAGHWSDVQGRVWLGHRRLAIVDLLGGRQPVMNETGDVIAVVSGELYDDAALRRQLVARGHRFRTRCDAELLVHLYEAHGPSFLEALRGEFAFVLWDARQQRLIAARDRFGVRPLLWARDGERLLLASEAKALFAAGVVPAWNETALSHAFQLQYPLPTQTLFAGVNALAPGEVMICTAAKTHIESYWDLDYPQEHALCDLREPMAEGEAIERTRTALVDAIDVRLRSDVPLCAHLSGGVDSSSVAAIAAHRLGQRLPCFSVGFDHPGYDEQTIATEVATHAGLELHPVVLAHGELAETFEVAVAHGEGLAINTHIAAKFRLNQAISRAGFKVALTGEGADEVFGGYAHLRADAWAERGVHPHELAALHTAHRASAGLMLPEGKRLDFAAIERCLGFLPNWVAAKGTLGYRIASLSTDAPMTQAGSVQSWIEAIAAQAQLRGRLRVHQSLYLWIKTALAGYILRTLGDGMEMAHGVEGRLPFLDHRLFETVRSIRPDLAGERLEKSVLREAVRAWVPEIVRLRPKHPFLAPPLSLVAPEAVQDKLRSAAIARLPRVNHPAVRERLDQLPRWSEQERVAWDPAWMLLWSAAVLQERYGL